MQLKKVIDRRKELSDMNHENWRSQNKYQIYDFNMYLCFDDLKFGKKAKHKKN